MYVETAKLPNCGLSPKSDCGAVVIFCILLLTYCSILLYFETCIYLYVSRKIWMESDIFLYEILKIYKTLKIYYVFFIIKSILLIGTSTCHTF